MLARIKGMNDVMSIELAHSCTPSSDAHSANIRVVRMPQLAASHATLSHTADYARLFNDRHDPHKTSVQGY